MYWLVLIFLLPYLFLISKIYLKLKGLKPFKPSGIHTKFVTVVAACRNEEDNLPIILKHLAGQEYDQDLFEVIIVDDNSSDNTFETVSSFTGIKNLAVIRNSGKGKKQALRTGIAAARGDLLITTDADCRMESCWLKTIVSFSGENKPDMIILPVAPAEGKTLPGKFQELEFLSLQGITAGTALGKDPVMCNGANLSFTKKLYQECSHDLHDELASGDDVFLLHKAKKEKGNSILWLESPGAMVKTLPAPSLGSFLKQRARWISKAGAYRDASTVILGLATFFAICLQAGVMTAGIFDPAFIPLFLVVFVLKSAADSFILFNTAKRYKRMGLMYIFPLAEIIYPFYVLAVIIYSVIRGKKVWRAPVKS